MFKFKEEISIIISSPVVYLGVYLEEMYEDILFYEFNKNTNVWEIIAVTLKYWIWVLVITRKIKDFSSNLVEEGRPSSGEGFAEQTFF